MIFMKQNVAFLWKTICYFFEFKLQNRYLRTTSRQNVPLTFALTFKQEKRKQTQTIIDLKMYETISFSFSSKLLHLHQK